MTTMTKGERDDLLRLVKQRERLAKSGAETRSAALLAEFEQQISTEHKFDSDQVWEAAYAEATSAFNAANAAIKRRCEELGIPEDFQPQLMMAWARRGENAFKERRDELRRTAKAEIAAVEKHARAHIEAESVKAQTQIISHGLTSEAAVEFLKAMPTVESLMPALTLQSIEAKLLEKKQSRRLGYSGYNYDA